MHLKAYYTRALRWILRLIGDYKAWRRGERLCAPKHAVRGRLYEKKDRPDAKAGSHRVAPRAIVDVGIVKIHADGRREPIGTVPGKIIEQPDK